MPEKIYIGATEETPEIYGNKSEGLIKISGRSIPHDAEKIFKPVLDWFEEYMTNPAKHTIVEFELDYFNTSSQKYMADIFKFCNKMHRMGNKIDIVWHYAKEDEDMRLIGEQFQNFIEFKINFIQS